MSPTEDMSVSDESRLFSLKALIEHSQPTPLAGPCPSRPDDDIIDLTASPEREPAVAPLIIAPLGLGPAYTFPTHDAFPTSPPTNATQQRGNAWLPVAALAVVGGLAVTTWTLMSTTEEKPLSPLPPHQATGHTESAAPPVSHAWEQPTSSVSAQDRVSEAQPARGDLVAATPATSGAAVQAPVPPQRRWARPPPAKGTRQQPRAPQQLEQRQSPKTPDVCAHCQAGDLACHIKCRAKG